MKQVSKKQFLLCSLLVLIPTELLLRILFGLGRPPLVQTDDYTGFRFQPNQKLVRFGKRIEYNQYSQRSEPIDLNKPSGVLRILMVGDSVLNGGAPTDQSQTITEQLEARIRDTGQRTEVLNASTAAWAIGNELGYLKKFGTFQSDLVILQVGTEDLTQIRGEPRDIEGNVNFPVRPPFLALQEIVDRYLATTIRKFQVKQVNLTKSESSVQDDQQLQSNLDLLQQAILLIRADNIPVYILFTPRKSDLIHSSHSSKYQQDFYRFLHDRKVPVFDLYHSWSMLPVQTVSSYFRDDIHLNSDGNRATADFLFRQLCRDAIVQRCSM